MCAPVFRLANNSTWCARSLYWRNIKIPISPLAETIEFRHTTLATSSLAFFLCHSFFDIHFFYGAAEENINYKNSVTLPSFLYLSSRSFFFRHMFFSPSFLFSRGYSKQCRFNPRYWYNDELERHPPATPVDASIKNRCLAKAVRPRPLDLYILIKASAIIGSRNGIFHGLNDRYNS